MPHVESFIRELVVAFAATQLKLCDWMAVCESQLAQHVQVFASALHDWRNNGIGLWVEILEGGPGPVAAPMGA